MHKQIRKFMNELIMRRTHKDCVDLIINPMTTGFASALIVLKLVIDASLNSQPVAGGSVI